MKRFGLKTSLFFMPPTSKPQIKHTFLCLHLPKAAVGHIVFSCDVMCVCHVCNQSHNLKLGMLLTQT